MNEMKLRCLHCKTEYEVTSDNEDEQLNGRLICPKCAGNHKWIYGCLEVIYDYSLIRENVNLENLFKTPTKSMWKFRDLLPVHHDPVTLAEGGTPFFKSKVLGDILDLAELYIKYEGSNPTNSFKDRESSVAITRALEVSARGVTCVSSGNAAASLAAYAGKAGLKCLVFTPHGASDEKLTQIRIFGAKLITIQGILEDVWETVNLDPSLKFSNGSWYNPSKLIYSWYYDSNPALNPYRIEGDKTEAYEIFCDLKEVPDWVVVPVGNGSNLAGIWKGFTELVKLDVTSKFPRMICVQIEGGAPVVKAWEERKRTSVRIENPPDSIAEGIVAKDSYDARKALDALYESKGYGVVVQDDETMEKLSLLARKEGVFVEPTSATVLAAVAKLRDNQIIDHSDKVVCILTGSGIKTITSILTHERKAKAIKKNDYVTLCKEMRKTLTLHFPKLAQENELL